MTTRPIIFSAPMVRALIEGRKTQTRRIIKRRGKNRPSIFLDDWTDDYVMDPGNAEWRASELPYAAGDHLWVRESFIPDAPVDDVAWDDSTMSGTEWSSCGRHIDAVPMKFRSPNHVIFKCDPDWEKHQDWRWRPSIHMPRWASRLTLTVTGVKVERLQDISEADAKAEGIEPVTGPHSGYRCYSCRDGLPGLTAISSFRTLWAVIHGPDAWKHNPWVAAITFNVEKKNIDT